MAMNAGNSTVGLVDNGITASSTTPVTLVDVGTLKEVSVDADGYGPVGGLCFDAEE
jgi:hypothetical protein